ncbi:MAG TPA: GTPase [Candidatus Bilamarchaeaceae archaeon]|nr:GTPase [Candidatus Bilamarchaeaceae archaeon]
MVRKKSPKMFWRMLREKLKHCEIVIEVLDARYLRETKLPILEYWAGNDRLIRVANKSDLVDRTKIDPRYLVFSAKENPTQSRKRLINAILTKREIRPIRVVVVGYPNVGKSSLINLLAGKKVAKTAMLSGTTKNIQWIRISEEILLMDTPGVFPQSEEEHDLLLKGAINISSVKNTTKLANEIIDGMLKTEEGIKKIEKLFGIQTEKEDRPTEVIEKIAKRRGFLLKEGEFDTETATLTFLRKIRDVGN